MSVTDAELAALIETGTSKFGILGLALLEAEARDRKHGTLRAIVQAELLWDRVAEAYTPEDTQVSWVGAALLAAQPRHLVKVWDVGRVGQELVTGSSPPRRRS